MLFCLVACAAFAACQPGAEKNTSTETLNEAVETDSILQVIRKETDNFFNADYTAWTTTWAHESYTMQGWNNDDSTFSTAIGWDAINKQGKEWIEKYYANGKNIIHPEVRREKPVVKFFNNNTAWLFWKQYNADAGKKLYSLSQETRIMEKKADGWKIVSVLSYWDYKNKIPADSLPQGLE